MRPISVSIIIATRNRQQVLWETVEKACDAIENKNTELIVINDGDADLEIPLSIKSKIQHFKNLKRGVSAARNLGVLYSKGELLFFIDDDMWITKESIDWICSFIILKENRESVYNVNWIYPDKLSQNLKNTKVGRYLLRSSYNTMWGRMKVQGRQPLCGLCPFNLVMSGSLVMSKSLFEKVGGYNENLIFQGEDHDLAKRLNQFSIKIFSAFDVTLFHNQQDRIEIKDFLFRIQNGYQSEFSAIKSGIIQPSEIKTYKGMKRFVFEIFRTSERVWIQLHKMLPNWKVFDPINNKLIGILSGLQRYKAWYFVNKSNKNPL